MPAIAFPPLPPIERPHPLGLALTTLDDEIARFKEPGFCGVDEEFRVAKLDSLRRAREALDRQMLEDTARDLAGPLASRPARVGLKRLVFQVAVRRVAAVLPLDGIEDPALRTAVATEMAAVDGRPLQQQIACLLQAGIPSAAIRRCAA
jgi:hypothetical protein